MTNAETAVPTEPVDVARGLRLSVAFQLMSKVAHVLLNVVSSLAIIRYLAPDEFGDYAVVVSLVTLCGILCDFGIDKFGIREISLDEATEAEVTGTVVAIRLVLSVIGFVLVQAVLFALGATANVHLAGAVASGLFVVQALMTFGMAFAVRIEQQFDALSQLAGEFVETALTLVLVSVGATLVELFVAPVIGGAVAVLLTITLTRHRYHSRVRFARERISPLIRGSFPIAIAGIVGIVLLRLDTLMLAAFRPAADVGIYGAAYQPLQYVLIANVALVAILLPLLSRFYATDRDRFLSTYRRGTEAILAFIFPVALILVVAAGPGVKFAYSSAYAKSAQPLRILSIAVVLLTLTAWEAVVLLAAGYQRLTVRYNLAALALGIVLHGALIPHLGPAGAALGTVGIALFTTVWSTALSGRLAGAHIDVARVMRVVIANVPVAVALLVLPILGLAWWAAILIAIALYPPFLRVTGVVPATWRASFRSVPTAPVPSTAIAR